MARTVGFAQRGASRTLAELALLGRPTSPSLARTWDAAWMLAEKLAMPRRNPDGTTVKGLNKRNGKSSTTNALARKLQTLRRAAR